MADKTPDDMSDTFKEVLDILQHAPSPTPTGDQVNIDTVIERLEEALERLNEQMEEVYKRTGMTQEQLEEYASNSDNFSSDEWSMLGQIKGELGKYREQAEEALAEIGPIGEEELAKQAASPSPKRRRRKSWLQS